ncbi:hypothetical protein [Bacillus toyonensis]|uniref:hypothetical protein n=1 Tax=Bacillus toyonensis TaxID=155322 RepID=UPI002E1DB17D|nr:hypothetical protein [Bacillus toyonensis]
MNEMLNLLDENKDMLDGVNIDKIKTYVKLAGVVNELESVMDQLFNQLNEDEKYTINTMFESSVESATKEVIPKYLSVREVAEMLDQTTQKVRKKCAEGKLKGLQREEGSHRWLIETSQFIGHPNLKIVLEKKEERRRKSLSFAEAMIKLTNAE